LLGLPSFYEIIVLRGRVPKYGQNNQKREKICWEQILRIIDVVYLSIVENNDVKSTNKAKYEQSGSEISKNFEHSHLELQLGRGTRLEIKPNPF
jgi:hypothetical protein